MDEDSESSSSLESSVEDDPKTKSVKEIGRLKANLGVAWRLLLAVVGLFDFLSTVLPGALRVKVDSLEEDGESSLPSHQFELWGHPIPQTPFGEFLQFLHEHSGHLAFAFSVLWCFEAFLDAKRSRDRALLERDRKRLLQQQASSNPGEDMDLDLGYLDDDHDTRTVFYWRIFVQLLMLPVGFWLTCEALFLHGRFDPSGDSMEELLTVDDILDSSYDLDAWISSDAVDHKRDQNLSLGFALLRMLLEMIVDFLNAKGVVAKKKIMKKGLGVFRQALGSAVRNPFKFYHKVQKGLTTLRWIKYLQPIIGNTNKLVGNLGDLTKKYRQRQQLILTQNVKKQLFRKMSTKERREYAAKKMQANFRAYQARRSIRAIKILQGEKEAMAALRLQSVFRRKLKEARARIKRRKKELKKLEEKLALDQEKKAENMSLRMNAKERLRLYQLEEEVGKESLKILQRRLLLKPNTRFSVTWRTIFCVCVVFEITGLVCNPLMKDKYKDHSGNPLTVETMMKEYVIPLPVTELKECSCEHSRIDGLKHKLLDHFHRHRRHEEEPPECDDLPWYCTHPYSTARSWYSTAMEFLIDEFLLFVGIVMFVDVPISFFTGEFEKGSDILVPKHWFTRWILPGLVLQFIVNPKMHSTVQFLRWLFAKTFELGPIRVRRWTLAVFYPFLVLLVDVAERFIWLPFIKDQNKQSLLSEARTKVMDEDRNLTESVERLRVSAQKKTN